MKLFSIVKIAKIGQKVKKVTLSVNAVSVKSAQNKLLIIVQNFEQDGYYLHSINTVSNLDSFSNSGLEEDVFSNVIISKGNITGILHVFNNDLTVLLEVITFNKGECSKSVLSIDKIILGDIIKYTCKTPSTSFTANARYLVVGLDYNDLPIITDNLGRDKVISDYYFKICFELSK